MRVNTRMRKVSVLGSLVVSGVLVASFAPGASASTAVALPGQRGPAQISVPANITIGPAGQTTSQNWSGYVDTPAGGSYTMVSSTWKEPAVSCTSTDAIAAFWVGIDGDPSGTVEQDGTLAYCQGGTPTYYTWWEMYPTNSVQFVGSSVQPGDKITSVVLRTGSSYKLTVTDATHPANSFTTTQSCGSCANSSAEWVAERPSGSGGLYPLANFGKMAFGKAKATSNQGSGSISDFPNDSITMINSSGNTLASVSPLKKQGSKFVDTWKAIA